MELRLGLSKQIPQWLCLVGSNPTLFTSFFFAIETTDLPLESCKSIQTW